MKDILDDYLAAKQAIYDHVGFDGEDWVYCPFQDARNYFWFERKSVTGHGGEIVFSNKVENVTAYLKDEPYDDEDLFTSEIYTQRFYKKWVYRGKQYTMIFTNPGVDGMRYFSIFESRKEVRK